MVVDKAGNPILKEDLEHVRNQIQNIPAIQVPDSKKDDNKVGEKCEPHKHRHEERNEWEETLFSPTDDDLQLTTPMDSPKRSKKLRTEIELTHRERTRSKTRQMTPQRP
jgi:hypothetical protein